MARLGGLGYLWQLGLLCLVMWCPHLDARTEAHSVCESAGPGACHSRITSVYRRTQHWAHHVHLQWASYWNTTITALERVAAPGEDTDFIVLGDEFGALAALDANGQHLASLPPPIPFSRVGALASTLTSDGSALILAGYDSGWIRLLRLAPCSGDSGDLSDSCATLVAETEVRSEDGVPVVSVSLSVGDLRASRQRDIFLAAAAACPLDTRAACELMSFWTLESRSPDAELAPASVSYRVRRAALATPPLALHASPRGLVGVLSGGGFSVWDAASGRLQAHAPCDGWEPPSSSDTDSPMVLHAACLPPTASSRPAVLALLDGRPVLLRADLQTARCAAEDALSGLDRRKIRALGLLRSASAGAGLAALVGDSGLALLELQPPAAPHSPGRARLRTSQTWDELRRELGRAVALDVSEDVRVEARTSLGSGARATDAALVALGGTEAVVALPDGWVAQYSILPQSSADSASRGRGSAKLHRGKGSAGGRGWAGVVIAVFQAAGLAAAAAFVLKRRRDKREREDAAVQLRSFERLLSESFVPGRLGAGGRFRDRGGPAAPGSNPPVPSGRSSRLAWQARRERERPRRGISTPPCERDASLDDDWMSNNVLDGEQLEGDELEQLLDLPGFRQ